MGACFSSGSGGVGAVKRVCVGIGVFIPRNPFESRKKHADIQVTDVKVPIVVDQCYCDKHFCKNQTGAIAISEVRFNRIIGTYAVQPLHLACSNDIPCTKVDLFDVQLKPSGGYRGF